MINFDLFMWVLLVKLFYGLAMFLSRKFCYWLCLNSNFNRGSVIMNLICILNILRKINLFKCKAICFYNEIIY